MILAGPIMEPPVGYFVRDRTIEFSRGCFSSA
jgi:hypothetical protein